MNEITHALNNLVIRAQRRNRRYLQWLLVVLIVLLMTTALLVIENSFERRSLVGQLNNLQIAAGELKKEEGQLLLEQSTLSGYNRVEWTSIQQLQMSSPMPDSMKVVYQR